MPPVKRSHPRVTVVVTPREQFRAVSASLESILTHTTLPARLLCVDGGSPSPVRRYLAAAARRHAIELIRTEHHLSPNDARTLALPHLDTEYVCFIDNDVVVTPGWLEALVRCADETSAGAVGPLYCNDDPALGLIHLAGGECHIRETAGRRSFVERHRFPTRLVSEVGSELRREPTEMIEYHCALFRLDAYSRLAPQDPRYLSCGESLDICLALAAAGSPIYLEPAAVVSNLQPPPFQWSDLSYYLLRWSDLWNRVSLACFRERWRLPADDAWLVHHHRWLTWHRQLVVDWLAQGPCRVLGWRRTRAVVDVLHRFVARRDLRRRPELRQAPRWVPPRPAAALT